MKEYFLLISERKAKLNHLWFNVVKTIKHENSKHSENLTLLKVLMQTEENPATSS